MSTRARARKSMKAASKKREAKVTRATRAWAQAIDDIIAFELAQEIFVQPWLYIGPAVDYEEEPCVHVDEGRWRRVATEERTLLLSCLSDAIVLYEMVRKDCPMKHRKCPCRAYCLFKVRATKEAPELGDAVTPGEIAREDVKDFNLYMRERN